jgi:hypothetical protein
VVAGILEIRLEGISNFQKGKIRCKSRSNLIKMEFFGRHSMKKSVQKIFCLGAKIDLITLVVFYLYRNKIPTLRV